eukprot:539895_1
MSHHTKPPRCICGGPLTITTANIYGLNKVIYCNNCLNETEIFYHCSQQNLQQHANGYDLCVICYEQLISQQQRSTHNISANNDDITPKMKSKVSNSQIQIDRLKLLKNYLLQASIANNCEFGSEFRGIFNDIEQKSQLTETKLELIQDGFSNSEIQKAMKLSMNRYQNEWQESSSNDNDATCSVLVSKCVQLQQLIKYINNYNCKNIECDEKDINPSQILDCFLHSLNNHNSSDSFEFIFNKLILCDITQSQCVAITRNFRRKTQLQFSRNELENLYTQRDPKHIIFCQILDRIHCYYLHSYDIGHRLSSNDLSDFNCMEQNSYKQMLRLLAAKLKAFQNIPKIQQSNDKFHQLEMIHQQDKMYSFGTPFRYEYKGEQKTGGAIQRNGKYEKRTAVHATEKYKSFKEELIHNVIATITIEQFNIEFSKCQLHFNSRYKMIHIPNISNENILSLMVYCNFDILQNLFSKTYRENITDHNNFYHFGKNLKMAVHKFGFKNDDPLKEPKYFYHGIGEKLLFPVFQNYKRFKISFCSPLSTSKCMMVAANFANDKQGLIIKFSNGEYINYFSCAWLSNYSSEKEMLFIQNNYGSDRLRIDNICDPTTGIEFEDILEANNIIKDIISFRPGVYSDDSWDNFVLGSQKEINISEQMYQLIAALIDECLPQSLKKHNTFSSLHPYAKQIITQQCKLVKHVSILYDTGTEKKNCLFFHSEKELVKLELLDALFPNLVNISVYNVKLDEFTMQDILWFFTQKMGKMKIKKVSIYPKKTQELSMRYIVDSHTINCKQLGLYVYLHSGAIVVQLRDELGFICDNLKFIGNCYFLDINDAMSNRVRKLVNNEICDLESKETDSDQLEFHKICERMTEIRIYWDNIHLLFSFLCDEKLKRMRFDMIMQLFPNIENIYMERMNFSTHLLDDIMCQWTTSKLKQVSITVTDKRESIALSFGEYREIFMLIDVKMTMRMTKDNLMELRFSQSRK